MKPYETAVATYNLIFKTFFPGEVFVVVASVTQVFCGLDDEASEVVLEAGWVVTPGVERLFTTRRYDARSGKLVRVTLGCERR